MRDLLACMLWLGIDVGSRNVDDHLDFSIIEKLKRDGYDVIVYLRTFPPDATEKEMRDKLAMYNLAHMLNVPSRLAMSYPFLRHTDPAKKAPKLDQVPVVAKLEKVFKEYRPPDVKK